MVGNWVVVPRFSSLPPIRQKYNGRYWVAKMCSYPSRTRRTPRFISCCPGFIRQGTDFQPRNHVLDYAHAIQRAPTRQQELYHTDQACIFLVKICHHGAGFEESSVGGANNCKRWHSGSSRAPSSLVLTRRRGHLRVAISTVSDPSGSGRVDMLTGPVAAVRAVVATGAWVKSKHGMYLIRGKCGSLSFIFTHPPARKKKKKSFIQ